MTITHIVAVKDLAIQAFMQPTTVRAPGQAMRGFGDEINRKDAQNELQRHPEDYELWKIGTFDDETGEINHAPELLLRGKDAKVPDAE